jgi:hypothetical protein
VALKAAHRETGTESDGEDGRRLDATGRVAVEVYHTWELCSWPVHRFPVTTLQYHSPGICQLKVRPFEA